MGAPVVALPTDATTANWGLWRDKRAAVVAWSYVDKVAAAGGAPLLLPPVPGTVAEALAGVDALLLTGGADINPARYGAALGPNTWPPDDARDATDFAALEVALRRGIPVLAVCRGMQVLAIARGGTLHQHLPEHAPSAPGRFRDNVIRIAPESRLADAFGTSTVLRCHHHQGLDRLGDGLVATAWAADGVVEAIEDPAAPFVVGVQAHPEESDTAALFKAFVAAAG
jgi:putative glutamine amidotransferase